MKTLSIDIETYSSIDLQKCGVYRYAQAEDFEILLIAYSVDGGEVQVVDLAIGEKIPKNIIAALTDENVQKWAYNAQFERVCLSRYLSLPNNKYLNSKSWYCSMVWAATLGLPLSLKGVGVVLQLDKQKMDEGKTLISYFCKPCKPTSSNGGRTRNMPYHALDKWSTFKEYNKRDVDVEMAIQKKLHNFPVLDAEWDNYHLDQNINDKGVRVDMALVNSAITVDTNFRERLLNEAKEITKIENPNSPLQLIDWLSSNGIKTESLDKESVAKLLENTDGKVHRVLEIRQLLSKTSIKKYEAIKNAVCVDGRVHGLLQFYGANRTGRWAGRLVQVQNLPQNHLEFLKSARDLIKEQDVETAEMLYAPLPNILSELIRTAFVPKENCTFFVADFAAIEARVIAWFAGEQWRQKVFEDGGDIYCASASKMFHVPVEKNGVNGHLRAKGKIAELALGYGGSVGALTAMGATKMGVDEKELQPLVTAWRNSNSKITKFWWDVDSCIKETLDKRYTTTLGNLKFKYYKGILFITLPSGRKLAYIKPMQEVNSFGTVSVTYEGIGSNKKWTRLESYGPKFVENIVQATARDILAQSMMRLAKKGYRIVMHVHDEVVIEAPKNTQLEDICKEMAMPPKWANDLLLRADGFVSDFYKKD